MFEYGLCKTDKFGLNPDPGGPNYLVLTADHMKKRLTKELEPELRQLSWLTTADPQSSRYVSYEEILEKSIEILPWQGMLYDLFDEAVRTEKRKDSTPENNRKKIAKLNALRRDIYDVMKDYARELAKDYVSEETGMTIYWRPLKGGSDADREDDGSKKTG